MRTPILWITLAIALVSSQPLELEEENHPDSNFLDATVYELSTDVTMFDAIDAVIQQLEDTNRTELVLDLGNETIQNPEKAQLTQLPKEVVISSEKFQQKANPAIPIITQRQAKRIRFDDDGVQVIEGVYQPDDPNDHKTYRNARVVNNQLVENVTSIDWAGFNDGTQGRVLGNNVASTKIEVQSSNVNEQQQQKYPDFYYKTYYNDDDYAESYEVSSTTSRPVRDPFGYNANGAKTLQQNPFFYISEADIKTASSRDFFGNTEPIKYQPQQYKQSRQLALNHDNQQFVVKQHNYRNADGSVFSVPIPFPVETAKQYNDQRFIQYDPYGNYQEKPKTVLVKEKVDEFMAKVHDIARPVVDPLKEAGEKISYNLGIHERMTNFQSRLSKASNDPKAMAMAGGAAALLGTIGAGLLFSGAAAGRSSKKLKARSNTNHTVTKRDADDELEQQQLILDRVLSKMDVSQRQFLDQMHKTGFMKSIEGPCGQAILCQNLASDSSDERLRLIEKRSSLFVQMLDSGEARDLQETLDLVISSAKIGDCSVFQCGDEAADSVLTKQDSGPR